MHATGQGLHVVPKPWNQFKLVHMPCVDQAAGQELHVFIVL